MAIVLIRAVVLYIVITFSLRLMGKRQLGELQPSELVVTILISNIAAIPVEDSSMPMIMGIVPILTLVSLDVIVSAVMLKSSKFRKLMIGSPRIIVSEGRILQKEMKKLRYTVDDLTAAMREQQIFDLGEVQYAIVDDTHADIFEEIQISQLAAELALEKCTLFSVKERDESLESFYMNLVGGERHA